MEIGIASLGDLGKSSDKSVDAVHARLKQIVEMGRMADQGGLDVFSLGEHHREDYVLPAPEIALAAIAGVTERIRLASSVTVLSSQDPVRVFEQFATLDHLSDGRAEIWAGRGAFVESFPLFGYSLDDYDALFEEKLDLLLMIRDQERVTWRGRFRSALSGAQIHPRPLQDALPIWIAVGGAPSSAIRAGHLGLPMILGFFAGPQQFVSRVDLYRRAAEQAGHPSSSLRVAAGGHVFVGKTSQAARERFFPYYSEYFRQPGAAQGFPREAYDSWLANGLPVGSPQQVIDDIMSRVQLLGIDRFSAHIDPGDMPWAMLSESLELYMTEVAPVLRRETATVAG